MATELPNILGDKHLRGVTLAEAMRNPQSPTLPSTSVGSTLRRGPRLERLLRPPVLQTELQIVDTSKPRHVSGNQK